MKARHQQSHGYVFCFFVFFTAHRRYCFKIWLITCISAGKKTDERISCTNRWDKKPPQGFDKKASHCERSKWEIDPNDIKAHLGGKWYNNKYINYGGKCVIEMIFERRKIAAMIRDWENAKPEVCENTHYSTDCVFYKTQSLWFILFVLMGAARN